jgi:hypothetical protein
MKTFQTFTEFLIEQDAHSFIEDRDIKHKLENPNTTLAELNDIFQNTYHAETPNKTPTEKGRSSFNKNLVFKYIAQHVNTDNTLLNDIYDLTDDPTVQMAIATNTNADETLLSQLARKPSSYTKIAVAANPNTHPTTLKYLATFNNMFMLENIAKNKNTPTEVLQMLLDKDLEQSIRKLILQRLK